MSWIYTEIRQFKLGRFYAIETIKIANRYSNYSLLGEGYFALQGHYPLSQAGISERIKLVNQSLLAFRKGNRIGLTYRDLLEYEKAYFYLHISLGIALKYQDASSIHEVSANTAFVLNHLGRSEESVVLLNQTLQKYPIKNIRDFDVNDPPEIIPKR